MMLSTEPIVALVWIGLLALAFVTSKALAGFASALKLTQPTPSQTELRLALDLDLARSEKKFLEDQFEYEKDLLEGHIKTLEAELAQSKAGHNEVLKQVIARISG